MQLAVVELAPGLEFGIDVAVILGRSEPSTSQGHLGCVIALGREPLELADACVAHGNTTEGCA